MKAFELFIPDKILHPLVLSIPHCGTHIDEEIKSKMTKESLSLIDTDWILQDLYKFAKEMQIPVIYANYSRYQIDLNRPLPQEKSLYTRKTSSLVPTHTFNEEEIYLNYNPSQEDIADRIKKIYDPYYQQIHDLFDLVQMSFDQVLLFDAHSIRRSVKKISDQDFSDVMLGNRDGLTCDNRLLEQGIQVFERHGYNHSNNFPFKGGNITRSFSDLSKGRHSIQLEMSQDIYMTPEPKFDRCEKMLKDLLQEFSNVMKDLGKRK
ncbi:MAG: N-formylglutamate amidohydrolase [Candidatus Cloacimonetes bacterium]|nr:N-formylglutamate amidohydrolase [Candidatus Cloacimonadota bacterium]